MYLIQHGDVIQDGHTLTSIDGQHKWPCCHEEAVAAPERVVVDVEAGDRPPTND
ncbi:hypothetical protein D3C72_2355210 [compost metagenome]